MSCCAMRSLLACVRVLSALVAAPAHPLPCSSLNQPTNHPPPNPRYAGVLWKSFETYSQISFRNRCLVFTDWLRTKMFGRDISRV
jgi:hypothetical protein